MVTSLPKGEFTAFFHVFGFARIYLDIAFFSSGG